ncbi:hypothetical protein HCH52_10565 [Oscillospiraceae bacterium HV4-5-C5C]|nr:hypothetical protein [Oscillospiraceae bacterium HV4-5-C5C]
MEDEQKNAQSIDETETADTQQENAERQFTQEEVDRIIADRLKRVNEDTIIQKNTELTERQAAIEAEAAELEQRENLLACRSFLIDKSYSQELLDIIDTTNPKEFMRKADIVYSLTASQRPAPLLKSTEPIEHDLSSAFKGPVRHTPQAIGR